MKRIIRSAVVLALALGLCGAAQAAESSDARALRQRATEYWKARVARDSELYRFYAPPEKGGPKQLRDIHGRGAVQYSDFEITSIRIEGDRGLVTVRAHHELVGTRVTQLPERFRWVQLTREWNRVDGIWYPKPRSNQGIAPSFKEQRRARQAAKRAQQAAPSPAPGGAAATP